MPASRARPNLHNASMAFAVLAALLAMVGGAVVLAGYLLDLPALRAILHGWAPMKPTSALCFILNGLALLFSLLTTGRPDGANTAPPVGPVCSRCCLFCRYSSAC
ncbi:hypothetical protein [Propionivibrio sp.]|uniref:hypothetical protein n=1 Tax=Propionivibrio sp. TaxID=2212460 RepID=UPI0025E317AB|nr:hypothetical protein [Propionivibrio sp.]